MTSFEDAVAYAKQIEKNAQEHLTYDGSVETTRDLDLYPEEVEELTYQDLVNLHEKIQKVIKASKLEIFDKSALPKATEKVMEARREEAETKVKKLTTQAVEELEKELAVIPAGKAPTPPSTPVTAPKPSEPEIVFEKGFEQELAEELAAPMAPTAPVEEPPKKIPAIPSPKPQPPPTKAPEMPPEPEIVFEKPPEEKKVAPPVKPVEEKPVERKPVEEKPPVPPPLTKEIAGRAGEQKYKQIQESFAREWGGRIEESVVKKKMLLLTKELFKEKSVRRREQIKTEIVVLKNMLEQLGEKKTTKVKKDYTSPLWKTLINSQIQEAVTFKDALANHYTRQVETIKKKFYSSLGTTSEEDSEARKKLYEQFVFELTHVLEKGSKQIEDKAQFVAQKHKSELEKLRKTVKDKKTLEKINQRIQEIEARYQKEFARLEDMLKKTVENLIEKVGHEILPAAPKEKVEKASKVIFEVNEIDEGTLLYYLHSKNPDVYKRYERKHLSKHEALFYAKLLMAKEKGLSDDTIRKYLGSLEAEMS